MFKAYKEPPKPSFDWKEWGVEKGIPLLGTVGGGIAGALIAPGDPAAISTGAQLGGNLGGALSGALTDKPIGQAQMMKGLEGGLKGYDTWQQKVDTKKLQTNLQGKEPGMGAAQPVAAPQVQKIAPESMIGSEFGSSRAGSFFGENALGGPGMQTGSFDTTAGQLTPEMQALLAKGRRR